MLLQLVTGGAGAVLATVLGFPLPFLLGSLLATGVLAQFRNACGFAPLEFPQSLRKFFMACVGVLIGLNFSPELLEQIEYLWISLVAVAVYVLLALTAGYPIFRKIGKLDPITALFAAMPGGLVEAVLIGEQAGANARVLTLQHFVRVILVVIIVPLSILIGTGDAVGSAAGERFSQSQGSLWSTIAVFVLAMVGVIFGGICRLPAKVLIGPLILSAILQASGVSTISPATQLLEVSQLVIGAGLGGSIAGVSLQELKSSIVLGISFVLTALCLAFALALAVSYVSPVHLRELYISFSPGGVTEMSLIALSFKVSPVIVAAHHVVRISFTVAIMGLAERKIGPKP